MARLQGYLVRAFASATVLTLQISRRLFAAVRMKKALRGGSTGVRYLCAILLLLLAVSLFPPGDAAAATAPAVELQVRQITDLGGVPKGSFLPGEIAVVWLQVAAAADAPARVSLAIDRDQAGPPYDYDSDATGESQAVVATPTAPALLAFTWAIPETVRPGLYSVRGLADDYGLTSPAGGETARSAEAVWLNDAIEVMALTTTYLCYRGQFHSHSNFSDGAINPQSCYTNARTLGLEAYALTDHEYLLTQAEWSDLGDYAAQAEAPGEYAALRGFEWTHSYTATGAHGSTYGEGHANVINSRDFLPVPDYAPLGRAPTDLESRADLGVFYEWVATAVSRDGSPVIGQFNHPSGGLTTRHFENFDPPGWIDPVLRATVIDRFTSFEVGTGVRNYYGPTWDPGNGQTNEILLARALNNGWRVAPMNDEDNATATIVATPRRNGLWAAELTRAGILEALYARRFFASEDVNFELSFFGDGQWMGSTLAVPDASLVTFQVNWSDPDDPLSAVWLVKSPGTLLPLSLAGKDLYSDTLSVTQAVLGGEWYLIKAQQQDGNLIYSAPIWIARTQPLLVEAGPDQTIAPGGSATLEGSATNGREPCTYSWSQTVGLSDPTIARPTASPAATTTYLLTVTDAVGQTASDSTTVTVGTQLAAEAGPDKTIASGGSTVLEGSAAGGSAPYTYSWSPALGLSDPNLAQPTASPTSTTLYTLTVTDSLGQTATDSVSVILVAALAASAGADKTIVAGGSTVLEGAASGGLPPLSYAWTPTTGLSDPNIAQPSAAPNVSTTYTLTVTDALGQTSQDSATVTVASALTANAGPDKTIAASGSTTLQGAAYGGLAPYSYSWSPAAGLSNPNVAQPTASPTATTEYTLTVTDALGQTAGDAAIVTVAAPVSANAGPDKTITVGGSALLEGSASGGQPPYSYSWSPAAGLNNPNIAQPTASPTATTEYTLTVTDALGQTAGDTVTVTVSSTTYTLQVSSIPVTGAAIGVSPADIAGQQDGSTYFTRTYNSGSSVSLTAYATRISQNGIRYDFQRWSLDGVDKPLRKKTITFTMTGNRQAVAKYVRH